MTTHHLNFTHTHTNELLSTTLLIHNWIVDSLCNWSINEELNYYSLNSLCNWSITNDICIYVWIHNSVNSYYFLHISYDYGTSTDNSLFISYVYRASTDGLLLFIGPFVSRTYCSSMVYPCVQLLEYFIVRINPTIWVVFLFIRLQAVSMLGSFICLRSVGTLNSFIRLQIVSSMVYCHSLVLRTYCSSRVYRVFCRIWSKYSEYSGTFCCMWLKHSEYSVISCRIWLNHLHNNTPTIGNSMRSCTKCDPSFLWCRYVRRHMSNVSHHALCPSGRVLPSLWWLILCRTTYCLVVVSVTRMTMCIPVEYFIADTQWLVSAYCSVVHSFASIVGTSVSYVLVYFWSFRLLLLSALCDSTACLASS